MSLVAEVLATIKKRSGIEGSSASGDGVCVEVADLAKRAGEAKVAVIQALEGQYDQLCTALRDTSVLQTRVSHNVEQLEHLKETLDSEVSPSVAQSVGAITSVAARLQQAEEGLAIAQQLLTVHEALRRAGDHNVAGRYFEAAKSLNEVDEILTTINSDIEILPGIMEEVVVQRTTLIYTLSQVWSKAFQWEEENHPNEQKKTITLLIKDWEKAKQDPAASSPDEVSLPTDFLQVVSALSLLDELHLRMAVLSNNILKNFFKVLVSRPARVSVKECGSCYALSITFSTSAVSKSSGRHLTQPSPYEVFTSCEQVLRCLHDSGFGAEFEGVETGSSGSTTNLTLMGLLGQEIGERFTSLVISECLAAAVPCSRKNLDQFDAVRDATQAFQSMLVSIGFYSESEKSILEYAANVDSVFSDRACAHLLDTARELIRQPLHNTVTIAEQEDYPPLVIQDQLPQDESGATLEKSTLRLEKLLSSKTFHMPRCQISKSIVEFVDLLYESLEEASSSSAPYAGRLVCTVRNMLTLYQSVTPVVHAHTLGTIPQHAALVHNNSMYISTHCYLLGHQYKSRLPAELRDSGSCAVTYTDLAYEISQMGSDIFCEAMKSHKKALIDTIGQAQGFGEVPSNSGVRQCIHQLQQLRNVWHEVLPRSVYHKAMGTLLNSVVRELIDRTLALEDISEASAQALTATLMLLKDGAPALFPDTTTPSLDAPKHVPGSTPVPKEGLCGVRQWGKFLELMVVLGASLRQLEDRWADGAGPLALYFTPDQAKALIRALFQNTEKRAALLAKIKRPC